LPPRHLARLAGRLGEYEEPLRRRRGMLEGPEVVVVEAESLFAASVSADVE
jgi:hypothetical protein